MNCFSPTIVCWDRRGSKNSALSKITALYLSRVNLRNVLIHYFPLMGNLEHRIRKRVVYVKNFNDSYMNNSPGGIEFSAMLSRVS